MLFSILELNAPSKRAINQFALSHSQSIDYFMILEEFAEVTRMRYILRKYLRLQKIRSVF